MGEGQKIGVNRRRVYFGLSSLLFLVACFAGFFGGLRIGYDRGYRSGQEQLARETLVVRVYPVEDLVTTKSGANFSQLIDLITDTVSPLSWEEGGGEGTIAPHNRTLALVVCQTPSVHMEIEKLLQMLRDTGVVPTSRRAVMPPAP